jgi:hypothetical protein
MMMMMMMMNVFTLMTRSLDNNTLQLNLWVYYRVNIKHHKGTHRLKQATIVCPPLWIINLLKTWHMISVLCNCFQIITFCYNSWVVTLLMMRGKKETKVSHEKREYTSDVKWDNAIFVRKDLWASSPEVFVKWDNAIFVRRTCELLHPKCCEVR